MGLRENMLLSLAAVYSGTWQKLLLLTKLFRSGWSERTTSEEGRH